MTGAGVDAAGGDAGIVDIVARGRDGTVWTDQFNGRSWAWSKVGTATTSTVPRITARLTWQDVLSYQTNGGSASVWQFS